MLAEGYSSLENKIAVIKEQPFEATWLTKWELRTPRVSLRANRHYWDLDRVPKLEEVVFRNDITKEQALDLCMHTEGEIDIVTQVDPQDAERVVASPFAKLTKVYANRIFVGVFNRFDQDSPFHDKRIRYAFNAAINKERLIEEGFLQYATPLPSLTPIWSREFPSDLSPIAYQPNEAKKLISKTNWPATRPIQIAVLPQYHQAANVVADELRSAFATEVNVHVLNEQEVRKWERALAEKRKIPDFDLFLTDVFALFTQGIPAFNHRELIGASGKLRTGPEIVEFEQLFHVYQSEVDDEKRMEMAKEIDRYVHNEALALFLCSPQDLYAVNRHVDFLAYRSTLEFAETSVTEAHWSRRNSHC